MGVNITSGSALARMQNAIMQGGRAFKHNMEPDIEDEWLRLTVKMTACRKLAMEKNEKHKELKNAQI